MMKFINFLRNLFTKRPEFIIHNSAEDALLNYVAEAVYQRYQGHDIALVDVGPDQGGIRVTLLMKDDSEVGVTLTCRGYDRNMRAFGKDGVCQALFALFDGEFTALRCQKAMETADADIAKWCKSANWSNE